MIVREYRVGDFPEVENLWKETGVFSPERGDTADTILRCNRCGGKFLILEDERKQRILGTSWLTWDGRRVHMQYFAVLPSMQGKGYGRLLAETSMSFARDLKVPIKLEVHRSNIQAIQLFRSMGFKILEGYEVYIIHYKE
jgi:ribosomal protein S18 acetylase RimI-like enzyme